jgi:ATP-dependent protease HslVU (ClpYQ) ATPase subunit
MECAAYEDIHNQYENNLKVDNMHQLFDGDKINQIASLLVKIHNRRSNIEKSVEMS